MSIEAKYLEGKARGFKHPAEVVEQLEVYKLQCNEVKRLKKVVNAFMKEEKGLHEQEEKAAKTFTEESTTDNQNPKAARVYTMYADALTQIAANRTNYTTTLQGVIADWKALSKSEISKLEKMLDTSNKSLVTRQYYEGNKEFVPAKQWDEKYSNQIVEFVNSVHMYRQQKEDLHPQFILRALQAESIVYRTIISQYEMIEAAVRTLGPVEPIKFPGFFMESRVYAGITPSDLSHQNPYAGVSSASTSGNPYMTPSPTVVTTQTTVVTTAPVLPPLMPAPMGRRARALYPFTASSDAELSFNVGDFLNIVSQDGGWWTAELNGRRGFVPSNYVELC